MLPPRRAVGRSEGYVGDASALARVSRAAADRIGRIAVVGPSPSHARERERVRVSSLAGRSACRKCRDRPHFRHSCGSRDAASAWPARLARGEPGHCMRLLQSASGTSEAAQRIDPRRSISSRIRSGLPHARISSPLGAGRRCCLFTDAGAARALIAAPRTPASRPTRASQLRGPGCPFARGNRCGG
jgi:hypothetical protein